MKNSLRAAFNKWKNSVSSMAISDAIQGEKRKIVISALTSFLKGNNKALLRLVLFKFSDGARRVRVVRQMNMKLLRTAAGGVFDSFNKWKTIPEGSSKDLAKASRFEFALEHFHQRLLKSWTFNPLKDLEEDAQAKEKKMVNLILWRTMSDWKKSFYIWHRVMKEQKIMDQFAQRNISLHDEVTKQRIIGWLNTGSKARSAQLIEILRRFKRSSLQSDIIKRIFRQLRATSLGGVLASFNKWKSIPEDKNRETYVKGAKFERKLLSLSQSHLRSTFLSLNNINIDGLIKKKRAALLILKASESDSKKALTNWNNLVRIYREGTKCKFSLNFFDTLGSISHNNLAPLMDQKGNEIREKALEKIIQNSNQNLKFALIKWRNYNQILAMQASFDGEKKKTIINTLEKYLKVNKTSLLRFVLKRFASNSGIKGIQMRLFKRLMLTKTGAYLQSFQKWKVLPIRQDNELFKIGSAFERKLNLIFRNKLKLTFDPMKDIHYDAVSKQKQCLRILIAKGMGAHKRLFLQWAAFARNFKNILACRLTSNLFHNLQFVLNGTVRVLLDSDRETKIKEDIIEKIIHNQLNLLRFAFHKWHNRAEQLKMTSAIDDEKKKLLILNLTRFLNGSKKGLLRQALISFARNAELNRSVRKINLKLLQTLSGKLFASFNKWRIIPESSTDNDAMAAGSAFEKKLFAFFSKNVKRSVFTPFYDIFLEGQARQKQCVNLLVYKCMSGIKQKFIFWHQEAEISKQQKRSKEVLHLLHTLNKLSYNHVYPLFEDTLQKRSKIEALKVMLQQWEEMFKDSFQKWKETKQKLELINQKLNNDTKNNNLAKLLLALRNTKQGRLRRVLKSFLHNSNDRNILRRVFLSLQDTSAGKVLTSFQKWKTIPDSLNREKLILASKFERMLFGLHARSLKKVINPFKDLWYDGLALKKRAILLLFKTQEGSTKQALNSWHTQLIMAKQAEKCKKLINIIGKLNRITAVNLSSIKPDFVDGKKKLFALLFSQHKLSQINQAFSTWRQCLKAGSSDLISEKNSKLLRAMTICLLYVQRVLVKKFERWQLQKKKDDVIQQAQAIAKMIKLDKVAERAIIKTAFQIWKPPKHENPWFKKVAALIGKNSRITTQISFWRMRDIALNFSGGSMDTLKIIKCKKLFNNLRKALDRIMTRSFMSIEQHGKSTESSFQGDRKTLSKSNYQSSQKLAIQSLVNLFKGSMKEGLLSLSLNFPMRQSIYSKILRTSLGDSQYRSIQKQLCIERIYNVLSKNIAAKNSQFLSELCQLLRRSETDKVELLEQVNDLIEEIGRMRDENQQLNLFKDDNDKKLGEAQETIDLLNTKLNYMMVSKFTKILQDYEDQLFEEAFTRLSERQK